MQNSLRLIKVIMENYLTHMQGRVQAANNYRRENLQGWWHDRHFKRKRFEFERIKTGHWENWWRLQFFFFLQKCPLYGCAVKVKHEIKNVVSCYQTMLSEKLCPPNQHLIYSLFIWRIKKELRSQPTFVKWKLKQTVS